MSVLIMEFIRLAVKNEKMRGFAVYLMSLVVRKPVFRVSDQVQHKMGCTVTQDG